MATGSGFTPPAALRRVPGYHQFDLAGHDDVTTLANSPWATRRLGSTIWHVPGGSARRVSIARANDRLRVEELFIVGRQHYVRRAYGGCDLEQAVDIANQRFNAFTVETGHRSHTTYGVGIQCWIGLGCMWDSDPFDFARIVDGMMHAQQKTREDLERVEARRSFLASQGFDGRS